MSLDSLLTNKIVVGNVEIGGAVVVSGGHRTGLDESIPDASTDLQINFTLDVSAVLVFFMKSDQNITIETNNGTTPDDTVTLTAGVEYQWRPGSVDAFAFGTDITALFVTNASGSAARLQIQATVDPTP